MSKAVHETTTAVAENPADTSELESPRWAVLSFEKVESGNLTYSDALQVLSELGAKGIPGLCIVTDQTAARLAH